MTIKQQGGIFGRNPTFNDAEVDDLTVTGSSTLNGAFSVQGNIGKLNQTADGNLFQIANGLNTEAAVVHVGSGRSGDGNTYIDLFGASGATFGARLIRNGGTNGATLLQTKGTGNLTVRTDDAAPVVIQTGGAEAARFNTSGNLAFPSGQGIDFSATSGTGTSELFDDYEEGSFTLNLQPASGSITWESGFNTLSYTKIGRVVHIFGQLRVDSVSTPSGITRGSLPFTQSSLPDQQERSAGGTVLVQGTTLNANDFGFYPNGGSDSFIELVRTNSTSIARDAGSYLGAGDTVTVYYTYIAA